MLFFVTILYDSCRSEQKFTIYIMIQMAKFFNRKRILQKPSGSEAWKRLKDQKP